MREDLKRSLGLKVRAARSRAGLTQDELASRIGKTPESVSNIERGTQTPSLETLAALAHELALPIAEFFDEDGDKRPVSEARLRAEARLRELVRGLDDDALGVVIEQISAFARHVQAR